MLRTMYACVYARIRISYYIIHSSAAHIRPVMVFANFGIYICEPTANWPCVRYLNYFKSMCLVLLCSSIRVKY